MDDAALFYFAATSFYWAAGEPRVPWKATDGHPTTGARHHQKGRDTNQVQRSHAWPHYRTTDPLPKCGPCGIQELRELQANQPTSPQ